MMSRAKFFLICGLLLFITNCFPEGSLYPEHTYKMPLGQEGEALIYLQPLPQESSRVRFIISGISALGDDGLEIPLALYQNDIKGADDTGRQKLLASGTLPPGSYSGLSIQIHKAWVQTEEGEVALLAPQEPFSVDQAFDVTRQEASTLFLTLRPSQMVTAGFRFTPGFSLTSAGRTLINLTGSDDGCLISIQ